MIKFKNFIVINLFLIIVLVSTKSFSDNHNVMEILELIQKDIKTLEKAVYSSSTDDNFNSSTSSSSIDQNTEDVLTRHLLKLSEIENQFQELTNKFEEINFKLDKLSSRITKIQTDNQVRFQDIESIKLGETESSQLAKEKKLPGSGEAQDLGGISDADLAAAKKIQKTQSVESVGTVLTEKAARVEKILPDTTPEEQYKFAVSFIKVGDYETAELALREFVDNNSSHELAGNAQYWYGETFRVRQLYQDAATAYLNGYQKYPKSTKASVNLLKLGVMLVQIGEKEQGCSMILGVKDQYPNANQSVIQKAEYEKKKFNCEKKS